MKEEYKEFIGIYDESVPVELCEVFVENYEEAKKNQTIIDCSVVNKTGYLEKTPNSIKQSEDAFVYPITSTIYPRPPVMAYFDFLVKCLERYMDRYSIEFTGALYNNLFKIHKVRKTEGYHTWHYEKNQSEYLDRLMAYMTYLEVPKEGGETEFLHQSLRVDPIVGRTLIWPAGFTHMHRGNPPLEGEKMYITGWFNAAKVNFDDGGK